MIRQLPAAPFAARGTEITLTPRSAVARPAPTRLRTGCVPAALAALLAQEPGFISYEVVVTGQGKRAAISIFDGAASLTAANGTIEGWLAERDSGFGRLVVQVATGEVVAQRGL